MASFFGGIYAKFQGGKLGGIMGKSQKRRTMNISIKVDCFLRKFTDIWSFP